MVLLELIAVVVVSKDVVDEVDTIPLPSVVDTVSSSEVLSVLSMMVDVVCSTVVVCGTAFVVEDVTVEVAGSTVVVVGGGGGGGISNPICTEGVRFMLPVFMSSMSLSTISKYLTLDSG